MAAARRQAFPAAVYALVDATPGAILLQGGGSRNSARNRNSDSNEEPWTRLFTAPLRVCAAYDAAEVPGLFAEIESAVEAGWSAAGFFSYECGACFERKAGMRPARAGLPLAWFGIYERGFVFDDERGEFVDGEPPELDAFRKESGSVPRRGFGSGEDAAQASGAMALEGCVDSEFALSEAEYERRIGAIHELIRAGDVYQLNFTAPLRVRVTESAAALYARLRNRQPAQYGAFVHWQEGRRILSFSPELFFRVDRDRAARRITARPMKGTAPRGRTNSEDRSNAKWLRNDAKNRSENLMIVDLLRNDLGRLARTGSVRAERLFAVERLPSLWQMTSTVTAELREEIGFEAIFRALFPCGSITGAPKIRAMQLIGEIEDKPRGVYTGAIGFFSPGQMVFNVAIRTLELDGERGTMGVGSGVVIDSEARAEYRECLLKAEFLTRQRPEEFSLTETMLWDGGYPLLELHLDRLAESAEYFDFFCERGAVKAALEAYAGKFGDRAARKVRLLLDADGGIAITDENLAAKDAAERVARVRIARECTDPADPMLFHKTTQRPLYARAFEAAARDGFADVLFFNLRGELTEGAISNVLIERNGRWSTPPVECGLLAGVYRRHLLESRPDIEELVLRKEDLRSADAVYLANAVRGLRRVDVEWETDKG